MVLTLEKVTRFFDVHKYKGDHAIGTIRTKAPSNKYANSLEGSRNNIRS